MASTYLQVLSTPIIAVSIHEELLCLQPVYTLFLYVAFALSLISKLQNARHYIYTLVFV
jgi:hypothetical protein